MKELTFGEKILEFYRKLDLPADILPENIDVMMPMKNQKIIDINEKFYREYYSDHDNRIFLIGINPGRFGGGLTGIPFTDPVNLQETLNIKNELPKRQELSSRFIYQVIESMGGPGIFFKKCYLTAVSPLGFVKKDRNLNYYDSKELTVHYKSRFVEWMREQVNAGARTDIAYSLGRGRNYAFLNELNSKYKFFNKLAALPHPRWVMQYRYQQRVSFVNMYTSQIQHYF